jgi:peptide chain release factor 1
MLEELKKIELHYADLTGQLTDPMIYNDPQRSGALNREIKKLQPLMDTYHAYQRAVRDAAQAQELLEMPEMRQLAREELATARGEMEHLSDQLQRLLLPTDPDDEKSIVLELRAGVGGEEGALFAADLYRMYRQYAEKKGWQVELAACSETELGGIKEAEMLIEGEGVYGRMKFEAGAHRVQRVPVTESSGRIQTSAATVAIMPEAEEVDFSIDPKDLRIDTYRSSGAGGQHVNKTSSAIRITYLPTGTVVECQDERSQYKNKDRAMKILRARLYETAQNEQDTALAQRRRDQVGSGDRSEKIRTYNFPQNRVTDRRITGEKKNFNLTAVLAGELDPLLDALIAQEQAQKMQKSQGE